MAYSTKYTPLIIPNMQNTKILLKYAYKENVNEIQLLYTHVALYKKHVITICTIYKIQESEIICLVIKTKSDKCVSDSELLILQLINPKQLSLLIMW